MVTLRRLRWAVAKSRLRKPLVWARHRGLEPSDVFLAGYPRSGTTWTRFMLYELMTDDASGFDRVNRALPEVQRKREALRCLPRGGRLMKTHELYRPDYTRAIYLARDVRSVVVSEHSYLRMKRFMPDQELGQFVADFLARKVNGFGRWTAHVDSWLAAREEGRVDLLVVRYEDLLDDTARHLASMADFLGLPADAAKLARVIANNSKEEMRSKEEEARRTIYQHFREDLRFVREARRRGWEDKLSADQLALIERRAGPQLRKLGYELVTRQVDR